MNSANLQQHVVMLEQGLQWARLKIQALTEELRLERIKRYGHKSETLSALQLELLDEEPGVTGEEVEAEARREPLPAARERERKPHPGRQILPDHLPRVEQVVACKESEVEVYVASGEPMDKAGACAIQGLASKFVTRIEGDYLNVVGLPVALVYSLLKRAGAV